MYEQQMRTIAIDELKKRMKTRKPYLLADARSLTNFTERHIPGAVPIPANEVEELINSFDKDLEVIIYCGGYDCSASTIAAKKFIEKGFKNVMIYRGGIKEWAEKGNPTENNY
ncbi:rhodanese-like domain-containing protein [Methanocella sp. CWC-04]|uniref:Rhodanese-like domain-containing protein n=1 Tax=Methanooceanicella nereidis TaxID=2052831 RepID=A0AAP2RE19_9EURY|nr:rhodanese-like domain-containing protein [Methanocella sp. CWC-04]MCD1295553.1 rhodanese-like domain-containing protein [Methanocella sp. CWC-04]